MKKLFVIAFAMLCSCAGQKKTIEIIQRDLTGEVVFKDVFLGTPNEIFLYGDLMLLDDGYDDKALSVIDMNKGSLTGRYLSIGRGPGEVAPQYRLYTYGDRLYAHQMRLGNVNIYSMPGMEYIETIELDGSPRTSRRMADYYIGDGNHLKAGRLQIYDAEGKYLFAGSDWPDSEDNMETPFGSVAYQGEYCTHPTENRYVFAASYSDKIEFHAIQGGKHVLISEYGSENVIADYESGQAKLAPNVYMGCASMWGGEDYCYMLYVGRNKNEPGVVRGMSDAMLQYDWDGNLIAVYQFDRQIAFPAVDESSGLIYGLTMDDDGNITIVRFDMSA